MTRIKPIQGRMIDMLDMTNQQLNVALAELTGFPADKLTPNYCNDPAASLEVQAKAIEVDAEGYVNKLTTIVDACIFWSSDCCMDPIGVTWLMTATPRERAEAAYMTLSSQDLHPLREDI
ncbi:hypothetical protein ACFQY3_18945 [Paenibacillus farraposensis]|uniref:hypothetical protein n=1 Tax=Paenibacillus farraposensis TaxID=2807095 RepID=UPI00360B18EB